MNRVSVIGFKKDYTGPLKIKKNNSLTLTNVKNIFNLQMTSLQFFKILF